MHLRNILLCFLAWLTLQPLQAQIRLPDGNTLHLVSGSNLLYLETRILFTTGKYKADDYRWVKISDSLDQRWSVSACFNGDCRNDLVPSGQFIKDFGLNDTTCFIAFHVETMNFEGTSRIQYKVINIHDSTDQALLTFNITYKKSLGITAPGDQSMLSICPNPFSTSLQLHNLSTANEPVVVSVLSADGRTLGSFSLSENECAVPVDAYMQTPGVYLLQ